jgi:predicted amidophosphoribosyltransferase
MNEEICAGCGKPAKLDEFGYCPECRREIETEDSEMSEEDYATGYEFSKMCDPELE